MKYCTYETYTGWLLTWKTWNCQGNLFLSGKTWNSQGKNFYFSITTHNFVTNNYNINIIAQMVKICYLYWFQVPIWTRSNISPESPKIVEFGTCSLHVVHGALKTGYNSANWCSIISCDLYTIFLMISPSKKDYFLYNRHTTVSCQILLHTLDWKWKKLSTSIKIIPHIGKYV